jgi:hypothetical protein
MSELIINNILNRIQPNNKILFVWSGNQVPDKFESVIESIRQKVANNDVKINVENSERLSSSTYSQSTFDLILSNLLTPDQANHNSTTLNNYIKLLKPKGNLILANKESTNLESELKLSGYLNVSSDLSDSNLSVFYCEKPNFELGTAKKLSFANKSADQNKQQQTTKVWQFTQDDVQESDLINTDDLLDDLDLKKPTIVDKFDCGTSSSGKKKACKNCSCGLAEELENEAADKQKKNVETVKSSCGSCYLGDAFRCASCPYLGMPAFKPGEKVQLGENLIKSDI